VGRSDERVGMADESVGMADKSVGGDKFKLETIKSRFEIKDYLLNLISKNYDG
jgi:hypothetical protein